MARISLKNLDVHFPVYGVHAGSLKKRLVSKFTGGQLVADTGMTIVQALNQISLELRDGDRLGLIGHNGAGKTTLLRTLSGIYQPTSGSLYREGVTASLIDPTLGVENDATGLENIMLRGLVMGLSYQEIEDLTPEISEFSGLGDYLNMPIRTYSTGMLMRLAFSISTSVKADILLMDEWLSVGDSTFSAQAEKRMRDRADQTGILVLASHSEELIERECNKVIRLEHGHIVDVT